MFLYIISLSWHDEALTCIALLCCKLALPISSSPFYDYYANAYINQYLPKTKRSIPPSIGPIISHIFIPYYP